MLRWLVPAFATVWSSLVVGVATVALHASSAAAGLPRDDCTHPNPSLHWNAVFAHVSSISEAIVYRQRAQAVRFENIVFEKDYCDDIEIAITGVDTSKQRVEFAAEAHSAGFEVSFEPPDILKRARRGYVKAVFGVRPTLSRADALQRRLASIGYREGSDIERLGQHVWRVVLYGIPQRVSKSFGREAAAAGFPVTFVR